jgi:hypothetical protein
MKTVHPKTLEDNGSFLKLTIAHVTDVTRMDHFGTLGVPGARQSTLFENCCRVRPAYFRLDHY